MQSPSSERARLRKVRDQLQEWAGRLPESAAGAIRLADPRSTQKRRVYSVVKNSTGVLFFKCMALRSVLARNLRRFRLERGLSQEALADRAGVDRTYISALERQRYSASIDMLESLGRALDLPPEVLISSSR
jgi:DNA-binding XRE family transcriptional regulator